MEGLCIPVSDAEYEVAEGAAHVLTAALQHHGDNWCHADMGRQLDWPTTVRMAEISVFINCYFKSGFKGPNNAN